MLATIEYDIFGWAGDRERRIGSDCMTLRSAAPRPASPMTDEDIREELEGLQQRITTLHVVLGTVVGLLHAKGSLQGDLSDEIQAMADSARRFAPTLAQSEWDAAWSLVSGFARIASLRNDAPIIRLEGSLNIGPIS